MYLYNSLYTSLNELAYFSPKTGWCGCLTLYFWDEKSKEQKDKIYLGIQKCLDKPHFVQVKGSSMSVSSGKLGSLSKFFGQFFVPLSPWMLTNHVRY